MEAHAAHYEKYVKALIKKRQTDPTATAESVHDDFRLAEFAPEVQPYFSVIMNVGGKMSRDIRNNYEDVAGWQIEDIVKRYGDDPVERDARILTVFMGRIQSSDKLPIKTRELFEKMPQALHQQQQLRLLIDQIQLEDPEFFNKWIAVGEDLQMALTGVSANPKRLKWRSNLQAALASYRVSVTGLAASDKEAKTYEGMFPSDKISYKDSMARLEGVMLSFRHDYEGAIYRQIIEGNNHLFAPGAVDRAMDGLYETNIPGGMRTDPGTGVSVPDLGTEEGRKIQEERDSADGVKKIKGKIHIGGGVYVEED